MQANSHPDAETAQTQAPRARRRRLFFAIAAALALAVLAWFAYWWVDGRFYQSTDDAYVGGNVAVVSPRVSGYVSRVLVADNAFVHAGQPLLELDDADFRARRDAAQDAVDAARAAVARLQAQRALTQAGIVQAQAQAEVEKAAIAFAGEDARRYGNLADSHSGTRQDWQRARSVLAQARARVEAALAAVSVQKHRLAVIDAQVVEAGARLAQAQATLRGAALQEGYTVIRAAIDGYVGNRSAHPGTFVAAGTQLMSLVPAQGLWIDANFKEDQIRGMKAGQPVAIQVDAAPALHVTGHVQSLSPATGAVFSVIPAQNATGNFTKIVQRLPVRIALDPADSGVGALRAGLSVSVTVDTRAARP